MDFRRTTESRPDFRHCHDARKVERVSHFRDYRRAHARVELECTANMVGLLIPAACSRLKKRSSGMQVCRAVGSPLSPCPLPAPWSLSLSPSSSIRSVHLSLSRPHLSTRRVYLLALPSRLLHHRLSPRFFRLAFLSPRLSSLSGHNTAPGDGVITLWSPFTGRDNHATLGEALSTRKCRR